MAATKPKARKRRETFGSIRQMRSGRYQASYLDPTGKRRNAPETFSTVTDARMWLSRTQDDLARGVWVAPEIAHAERARRNTTFGEFSEKWLATKRTPKGLPLRPNTVMSYRRHLDNRLATFHGMTLPEITPGAVRDWHNDLLATGHISQTAGAYKLLSAILSEAVERELIPRNPCRIKGAAYQSTGRKVIPPTREELDALVATIDPRYKAMVLLMAWGGLRFGEAAELRRGDLAVTRGADGSVSMIVARVERAVVHVAEVPKVLPPDVRVCDCTPGCTVGPPKSAKGVRSVALPPFMYADLLDHLDSRTGRFGKSLLFRAPTGSERHLSQPLFWWPWNEARTKIGRPDLAVHSLRHFAATAFAQTGATTRELLDRLGHTTIDTSLRYQHSTGRDGELAALMG